MCLLLLFTLHFFNANIILKLVSYSRLSNFDANLKLLGENYVFNARMLQTNRAKI